MTESITAAQDREYAELVRDAEAWRSMQATPDPMICPYCHSRKLHTMRISLEIRMDDPQRLTLTRFCRSCRAYYHATYRCIAVEGGDQHEDARDPVAIPGQKETLGTAENSPSVKGDETCKAYPMDIR